MKLFLNLKIRNKILIAFSVIVLLMGVVGLIGITNLQKIGTLDEELYNNSIVPISIMETIQVDIQKNRVIVKNMILENNAEKNKENKNLIAENDKEVNDAMNKFKNTIKDQKIIDEFNELKNNRDKYTVVRDKVIELALQNKNEEALALSNGDGANLAAALDDSATKIVELQQAQGKDNSDINSRSVSTATIFMLIVILFGIIIAIVLGIFIAASISKPINKVLFIISEMSKGHFGERANIKTKDEIGEMAKVMDAFADELQNEVIESMNKIAKGEVNIHMLMKDEKDEIAPALNKMIENVKRLVADATMLSRAAIEGKLDIRADSANHSGDFKMIVDGVNELIDAMVQPIKEVTDVMSEISKGNLEVYVKGNYKGEFGVLANAVNTTQSSLKAMVGQISNIIGEISKGNLDIEDIKEFDGNFKSISISLNKIVNSLNEVLSEINSASEQVFTGASQVSDGSQALSKGATEQASAIEELTSSMTEIAAQTKENADNANSAKELALKVKKSAEEGNGHMNEMLKSMSEINEASSNISKIIKVIDEIAFQTNILALNAAVEAARAGQHGKGFAVVAEEVRNLAARSANAAKETTTLIEGSIEKTERGTEIANNTAKALFEIVDGVANAAALVSEIAAASEEQASGISQINIGIEQVAQVVQTNSATAEESAAASEELSSQAKMLKERVYNFKLRNRINVYNYKQNYEMKNNIGYNETAAMSNSNRTYFSDNEFGKY